MTSAPKSAKVFPANGQAINCPISSTFKSFNGAFKFLKCGVVSRLVKVMDEVSTTPDPLSIEQL